MNPDLPLKLAALADRLVAGGAPATAAELLGLLRRAPREELREAAHRVTEALVPKRFDFCGIVNARSGRCSENCKWCAQSAHWKTGCEVHGWIGTEACVKAAADAEANGVAGPLLTTPGADYADDRAIAAEAGYSVAQPLR